jgi:hypothetical protein
MRPEYERRKKYEWMKGWRKGEEARSCAMIPNDK